MPGGFAIRFRVLGCYGGREPGCYLPSFLIDEFLLLDAGCAASTLTVAEQTKLEGILISHSHLDHIGEIPFIADNIFGSKDGTLPILSLKPVLDDLHSYLFNNIIWPDFSSLSAGNFPVLEFNNLKEDEENCINGLCFTAYRVHHTVSAVGYIIRDHSGSIIYSGDTGPTKKIWEKGKELKDLRAIITEVSFPNHLQSVADAAGHFTPNKLAEELQKMPAEVPVYLFHEKTRFHKELQENLEALNEPRLRMLVQGKTYEF